MHMSERERFQVMMLDHLYGLLEPSEAQELEAYLNSPEGENLRQQGEEWKLRLSAVAKSEFPAMQFLPPNETVNSQPAAKSQPATPRSLSVAPSKNGAAVPKRSFRFGWAIAASLLIVALGFGVPVLQNVLSQRELEQILAEKQAAFRVCPEHPENLRCRGQCSK